MPLEITEALAKAVAIKEKTIDDGRSLAKKGQFKNLCKNTDGTLLWGECEGSKLYNLSLDVSGDKPLMRCTCPVKPPPCKHILGLIVHYATSAAAFKTGEPPAELMEKREKAEARAEAAAKPKKVDKKALEKKTKEQRDALDLLEKLVIDLAAGGLGTIDSKKATRLGEQAKQLTDAYLRGGAFAVRRLAMLANPDSELGIPDDERHRQMIRQLVRLWAVVRKGQKYLDEKLDEGESQGEADAVVEELLGKAWQLAELKEKGSVKQNAELLELAFERYDDPIREERIEQSFVVDLTDGALYADVNMRPHAALDKTREKESYEDVITVPEAVIYPGFVNRRLRWEILQAKPRRIEKNDWERVHKAALGDVAAAAARFKEQIKNPLAPDDAVFLLKAKEFVRVPAGLALVDEKGARLLIGDPPLARYRTARNLEIAAGALKGGCTALVRFWLGLADYGVRGQVLALVAGDQRLRLGM